MRQWTSRDGTATLEARLHRQVGDDITLILPNGRSQVVKRDYLSEADLEWIAQSRAEAPQPASGQPDPNGADIKAKIPSALEGRLVDASGKPYSLTKDGAGVPKYYLFYYSASWCPPCVRFTPDLVRFYNRMKASNPELLVVLVPSDKSSDAAVAYMKKARMSFPGVDFDQLAKTKIPGNPGNGIPALRLTDADGKDLLTSAEVGRGEFLEEARKLIAAN